LGSDPRPSSDARSAKRIESAILPSSESDPDPLLLLIEELETFDPGKHGSPSRLFLKGANGGMYSLDLPSLASSSEAGNDPNGGI
jgi:hypothetical protein